MKNSIIDTIKEFSAQGYDLTIEEFEGILNHCERKMDVAKISDREAYRPLLFRDEIKNFFIRKAVNAPKVGGKVALCVYYAEATPA